MKETTFPHHVVAALICALLLCTAVSAQQPTTPQTAPQTGKQSVPKIEIGAQSSQFYFGSFDDGFSVSDPPPGFGGRITYNLTDHLAAEAEVNFFPFRFDDFSPVSGGRASQGQFGVKAGKHFRHFGIFAKARPGFVSFGETTKPILGVPFIGLNGQTFFPAEPAPERKTHFSLDVGGVVEVYASRRLFARFDAGDTMIRYGRHDEIDFDNFPIVSVPARTRHYLQINAGVGVRLGSRGGDDSGAAAGASAARPNRATRFEAGAQSTSLSLSPIRSLGPDFISTTSTFTARGFGGRFTYNPTGRLALEAEINRLPRHLDFAAGASGRVTQGLFGVKAGHRFHSFGVFAKARPGFVSFGSSLKQVGSIPFISPFNNKLTFRGIFAVGRRTYFAADVGGVFELYPSRRWLVRFDGGDTIIRYVGRSADSFSTNEPVIFAPPETRHNLQLSTGVGFRF